MPGKILIADDSANTREILQMNLETLGYEVVVANDGDQAMERIHQDHPDLLILDVMMPKQNGYQVCRKVKTDPRCEDTPVILLTAKSQREDMHWGRDCGADEYVTKPFSSKELEEIVERLLAQRAHAAQGPAGNLEDEMERRRSSGGQGGLCVLKWDPKTIDVYRKKYGEVRYRECLDRLRKEGEEFVETEAEDGQVELIEKSGLRILVSGDRDEIEDFAEELSKRLSRVARGLYDPKDRQKKAIEIRDFRTGKMKKVPLLTFTSDVSFYGI